MFKNEQNDRAGSTYRASCIRSEGWIESMEGFEPRDGVEPRDGFELRMNLSLLKSSVVGDSSVRGVVLITWSVDSGNILEDTT